MPRHHKIERPPESVLVADPTTGAPAARLDALDLWRRFDFSDMNRLQRIVGYLQAREQEALTAGLPRKKAKGMALRSAAKEFGISTRAVQQAERRLRSMIEDMLRWSAHEQAPAVRTLIELHAAIEKACELLQMRAPGPLPERALGADSPERLAATFASAFICENERRIAAERRADAAEKELKDLRTRAAAEAVAPGFTRPKQISAKH